VVDPASGHTKGEVFAYVDAVADLILADIADRPLSLVRCPDGTAKACFYQKHVAAGFPASIHRIPVEEDDGVADYVSVSDRAGLLALVRFGVLEFHPWGSRADRLDRPDRVIFDLDPDPTLSWSAIVEGAERLREILDALGLRSFARVTGGKGVHLVAPIERRYEWDLVKGFTRAVADALVAESPDRYTATLAKAKRTGKTFVDYLRNGRGATAVCSWSTRARPGLPVAVPVTWEELRGLGRADSFGIAEATERAKGPDPWDGYAGLKQRLPKEVGG
jgi:bifunctional non-homologous end joining protein LigD